MSVSGFPPQIRVVLGDYWVGGGSSGLSATQEIILNKFSETANVVTYTEKSGDNTPSPIPPYNRLKVIFDCPASGFMDERARIMPITTLLGSWLTAAPAMYISVYNHGTPKVYSFLEIWSSLIGVGGSYNNRLASGGGIGTSWHLPGTIYTIQGYYAPSVYFRGHVFTTLEQYEPGPSRSPDKTTYRYG